jgi:hypothetical protein
MRAWQACAAALVLLLFMSAGSSAANSPETDLRIQVLSNRADLISGGDALVAIEGIAEADALELDVDGRDVGSAFARRPNGRFEGLLQNLKVGKNVLRVRRPDGSGARIVITNHPLHGPVIAGPQVLPWFCATEAAGLGPSQAPYCETAVAYTWFYLPQICLPLPSISIDTGAATLSCPLREFDPEQPPSDAGMTTTDQGRAVPFIVRVETGVIDRGIYRIAVLYDPSKPEYEPWAPQDGYNGKVLMSFGGDCTPRHGQGQPISVQDVTALSRGFAVMTSGLNILGRNCNDVVAAESLIMLKEHFIETYGEVRYTIGNGASGGSMQQQWIVSNYPGLLDGIQPTASFPDIWQPALAAEDCHLLDHVFQTLSPHLWLVVEQQALAAGYALPTSCLSLWDNPFGFMSYARTLFDPDHAAGCQGGSAAALAATGAAADTSYVYDALSNPGGVRCTVQDYGVAIWGRREIDGFANRPFDNVGVQYGLQPLESGLILPEQFVDLNEKIGGLDIDWNYQPQRSEADPEALEIAYRSGRVNYPREAAKVPIIDLRGNDFFEIHTDVHSYTMRERLVRANGHHDNQIIWTGAIPLLPDPVSFANAFVLMDLWLAAIEADTAPGTQEQKVVRNKPAQAVDACWIAGQKVTNMTLCRTLLPYFGTPRIAAGAPLADDILKCQLKPLDRADYRVTFTDDQWTRLQKAFPTGVCDYRLPGVAQQPSIPWLTFAAGPGGQPLGDAPVSSTFSAKAESGSRYGGALSLALLPLSLLCLAGRHLGATPVPERCRPEGRPTRRTT